MLYLTQVVKIQPTDIYVAEQLGSAPFSRGLMFNAMVRLISGNYHRLLLHDVDLIPLEWDLAPTDKLTHLFSWCSLYAETLNTGIPYADYVGGSVLIPTEEYVRINGFDNGFVGWGAEDDNFRDRAKQFGSGWVRRSGKMLHLPHERQSKEFAEQNDLRAEQLRSMKDSSSGLSSCNVTPDRFGWFNGCPMFSFAP